MVIPFYQQAQYLPLLIPSLEREFRWWPHFEVILVDDCSEEPLEAALSSYQIPFTCRVVRLEDHSGASAARNRGAREAKGVILLFIDGDVSLSEGCISGHWEAHQGDATIVVIGQVVYPPGVSRRSWVKFLERSGPFRYPPGAHLPGRLLRSGHFSLRKELFWAVGGFNEEGVFYGEDIDLGIRLEAYGAHLIWAPHLKVVHHHIRSWKESFDLAYQFGRQGLPRLIARYPLLEEVYGLKLPDSPGPRGYFLRWGTSSFLRHILTFLFRLFDKVYLPDVVYRYLLFTTIFSGFKDHLKDAGKERGNG